MLSTKIVTQLGQLCRRMLWQTNNNGLDSGQRTLRLWTNMYAIRRPGVGRILRRARALRETDYPQAIRLAARALVEARNGVASNNDDNTEGEDSDFDGEEEDDEEDDGEDDEEDDEEDEGLVAVPQTRQQYRVQQQSGSSRGTAYSAGLSNQTGTTTSQQSGSSRGTAYSAGPSNQTRTTIPQQSGSSRGTANPAGPSNQTRSIVPQQSQWVWDEHRRKYRYYDAIWQRWVWQN